MFAEEHCHRIVHDEGVTKALSLISVLIGAPLYVHAVYVCTGIFPLCLPVHQSSHPLPIAANMR